MSNLDHVSKFCDVFTHSIDVVDLNAGVVLLKLEFTHQGIHKIIKGFEKTFATNHLGHFLLSEKLLKKSKVSRVIVVSSGTHDPASRSGVAHPVFNLEHWAFPMKFTDSVYSSSKLANMLFGMNLADRNPNLIFLMYDPGFIGDTGLLGFLGIIQPNVKLFIDLKLWVTSWWYGVRNQTSSLARSIPFLAKMCVYDSEPFILSRQYFSIDGTAKPSIDARDQVKQRELYDFSMKLLSDKGYL